MRHGGKEMRRVWRVSEKKKRSGEVKRRKGRKGGETSEGNERLRKVK